MTNTFRAAYVPPDFGNSAGIRLTTEYHASLPDADLIASAMNLADEIGMRVDESEIIIGDWTE